MTTVDEIHRRRRAQEATFQRTVSGVSHRSSPRLLPLRRAPDSREPFRSASSFRLSESAMNRHIDGFVDSRGTVLVASGSSLFMNIVGDMLVDCGFTAAFPAESEAASLSVTRTQPALVICDSGRARGEHQALDRRGRRARPSAVDGVVSGGTRRVCAGTRAPGSRRVAHLSHRSRGVSLDDRRAAAADNGSGATTIHDDRRWSEDRGRVQRALARNNAVWRSG